MSDPVDILDYWIGEVGADGWFAAGEALDADTTVQAVAKATLLNLIFQPQVLPEAAVG